MAKKAFNLGDYLKPAEGVSNSDTEQIVRIDLDLIDADPNNFYSLEGIEELAANIELVGLLDALRVRPNGQRYTIVSGHRRRAALQLIRDGGSSQFDAGVPCIVEYGEASDAMRELRLIYANSATRVMSAADLSKQAERVTELLYRLKEQGVEFPGRMRDHVAEACRVSAAKIGRLKAIRGNLRDSYRLLFDAGKLNEGSAYRISQEEPEVQKKLFENLGTAVCDLNSARLEACIEQVKRPEPVSKMDTQAYDPGYDRTRAQVDAYLEERTREDLIFRERLELVADRFLLEASGSASRQAAIDMLKNTCRHRGCAGGVVDWQGSGKGLTVDDLGPHPITRTWTETYDVLCQIAVSMLAGMIRRGEDIFGDDETRAGDVPDDVSRMDTAAWIEGDAPGTQGRYLCLVDLGTNALHEQRCDWDGSAWSCYGRPIEDMFTVKFYWPLPPERQIWKEIPEEEEA